jgi:hypothetical protein
MSCEFVYELICDEFFHETNLSQWMSQQRYWSQIIEFSVVAFGVLLYSWTVQNGT